MAQLIKFFELLHCIFVCCSKCTVYQYHTIPMSQISNVIVKILCPCQFPSHSNLASALGPCLLVASMKEDVLYRSFYILIYTLYVILNFLLLLLWRSKMSDAKGSPLSPDFKRIIGKRRIIRKRKSAVLLANIETGTPISSQESVPPSSVRSKLSL